MRWTWTEPVDTRNAWLIWAVYITAMIVVSVVPSEPRSVTPAYRDAAHAWWAGDDLYSERASGFLYLPQAAVMYSPFAAMPPRVSEAAWRLLSLGLLAWAIGRLSRQVERFIGATPFLWVTLFSLGAMAGMARNGQMSVLLTACMIAATVATVEQKWTAAAAWLCVGVALKPLMIVLLLLAVVLYTPIAWRTAIGLVITAAAPFATQRPGYVIGQYIAFAHQAGRAPYPGFDFGYADLFHMLKWFGWPAPRMLQLATAAAAAIIVLALCIRARRSMAAHFAVWLTLAWAMTYLMLFNPRVEHNTYGMIAPLIALFAFIEWRQGARRRIAWLLVAAVLALADPDVIIFGEPQRWARQIIVIGFAVYLLYFMRRRMRAGESPRPVAG